MNCGQSIGCDDPFAAALARRTAWWLALADGDEAFCKAAKTRLLRLIVEAREISAMFDLEFRVARMGDGLVRIWIVENKCK